MSIASKFFVNKSIAFPYIHISGAINRETTLFVDKMLKKVPSKTQKLGIVINSNSGSLAQAHIINTKINKLSKQKGFQVYTFIEESAVNAGFLLAINGHKIFADSVSVIGGLQVSTGKLILGEMIDTITYKNDPSLASELSHNKNIDPVKKQQLQRVFKEFSQEAENEIRRSRKTSENVDLKNFFTAKEAKQHGLIDDIGRINQVIAHELPQYEPKKIQQSQLDKIKNDLKRYKLL